jgi:hypothetical protein
MFDEKLNRGLESTLLARLNSRVALWIVISFSNHLVFSRTYQITTNSKAVGASRKVLAHISRFVLAITKEFIRDFLFLLQKKIMSS